MKRKQITLSLLCGLLLWPSAVMAKDFHISGGKATLAIGQAEKEVTQTALSMLKGDWKAVFGTDLQTHGTKGDILAGVYTDPVFKHCGVKLSSLKGKHEAFLMAVNAKGQLIIAGSDAHGAAYGLLELSRHIGVSPWEWWADATPRHQDSFTLSENFKTFQQPDVAYRGIFINDEDWGLMPWSYKNHDPNKRGIVGPKTTARIFELLLRLRANTYWPPMHECTHPFFLTKGNREVAKKYGIYMGGSHCEPMASSTAGEWRIRGNGDYDYVHNSQNVYKFWEDRVKDVAGQEVFYTVGMRGVHDGAMNGAKTVEEQKNVLTQVLKDQRAILAKYVNKDVTKVPQVFIPYKEVLNVYNAGLQVPEDITLMWCDDNYGYIRHFPTAKERVRKGGNGLYYHISYWGRPHDYLWLGTFSPSLLYEQMKKAYDGGIQKAWILNVGDIKPSEYQIELFMDMAWNIDKVSKEGLKAHLNHFLTREFGQVGNDLTPLMQEYYRLMYVARPEFLGHTRTEERDPQYKIVSDMPWSETFIRTRLQDYKQLTEKVSALAAGIPEDRKDAFYQLVEYPVLAAGAMNDKMLTAQLARHGKADFEDADHAFNRIVELTNRYNKGIHNKGKWNFMMDYRPRELPVFEAVVRKNSRTPLPVETAPLYKWNGAEFAGKQAVLPWEGLGYEGKAAEILKGKTAQYPLETVDGDSLTVEVRLLPSHPMDESGKLRFEIWMDNGQPVTVSYETQGRSEEWKLNVLRNQAIRRVSLPLAKSLKNHTLYIKALDNGVVVDQVRVYANTAFSTSKE